VRKEKVKKGSRTWKKRTRKNKGTNPGKKKKLNPYDMEQHKTLEIKNRKKIKIRNSLYILESDLISSLDA
jgi:hypothetical protein